jgi:hypothetical protein
MDNEDRQLLFLKGLSDNPEHVNTTGIRNLLDIFRSGTDKVLGGDAYGPGAFDVLDDLLRSRRDLFAAIGDDIESLLIEIDNSSLRRAVERILESIGRLKASRSVAFRYPGDCVEAVARLEGTPGSVVVAGKVGCPACSAPLCFKNTIANVSAPGPAAKVTCSACRAEVTLSATGSSEPQGVVVVLSPEVKIDRLSVFAALA